MVGKAFFLLSSLKADRKGVTALEYGVIAAVLVVAVSTAIGTFGDNIGTFFTTVTTKVNGALD
jgi:pilus assembly protein Flp/PilA